MIIFQALRVKALILIFFSILLITIINIFAGYLFTPSNLNEKKVVIVKKGVSTHQISILLEKEAIIKYPVLFEVIGKIYSLRHSLKSGEYEFTKGVNPYQILLKLSSGTSIVRRLVIREGETVNEIIKKINAEDRLFGIINSNIPEGYLMPSTYFYSYGDQKEKIINEMRKGMSNALDKVMLKLADTSPLKTRKEVLILASIVEKEAGNDQEKAMIAAVFINRLRKNMKLQADPTVIYAITEGKYILDRSLTSKDLKIESKYNTYLNNGLPARAISCPGLASLEAVVSPAITNALYFVANGQGGHNFSSTLNEHNVNVYKFRQLFKTKSP